MCSRSIKSVEVALVPQENALRAAELLGDVVEAPPLRLRHAVPGDAERHQRHGHEDQVDGAMPQKLGTRDGVSVLVN